MLKIMRIPGYVRFVLLTLGALGVAAACAYGLRCVQPAARTPKTFARDMADGLRVWNPKTGVDCLRIGSCRLEKRKMGPVTLGGLNILLLDDVVLNLPFPDDIATNLAQSVAGEASVETKARKGENDAPLAFLSGVIPASVRASGVRITKLTVNRVTSGGRLTPVFAADELRNRGKTLQLSGCRVVEGARTNRVGEAVLTLEPKAVLSWTDGQLPLDDLFAKPEQSKQRN